MLRVAPIAVRTRTVLVASAIAFGCLVQAVPAIGATQIGQAGPSTGACAAGLVAVQDSTGAPPVYAVPAGGGVITSWSHQAAAPGGTLQLKVFRPTGVSQYLVVAQSPIQTLVAGLNTFPTRIAAQAGDLLALYTPSGLNCVSTTGNAGDVIKGTGSSASDPAPQGSGYTAPVSQANVRLAIAASVEADADSDGFGDESQDGCPSNASTQGACPPAPPPPPPPPASPALLPGDCANVKNGTAVSDALNGTTAGDRLLGLGGADIVNGFAGNDCLEGGAGNDNLSGGSGNDRLGGGSGNDVLSGGTGKDRLSGGGSNDNMNGGTGGDVVDGGSGNDSLKGGSGADRISGGLGKNKISAGPGNDAITAVNGRIERINCGVGRDRVTADKEDRLVGCERVKRAK